MTERDIAGRFLSGPWHVVLAYAGIAFGIAIVTVRFPPDDLTGWIARLLHAPLGVPYLLASALFIASGLLLRRDVEERRKHRFAYYGTFIAASLAFAPGILNLIPTST